MTKKNALRLTFFQSEGGNLKRSFLQVKHIPKFLNLDTIFSWWQWRGGNT